ncbi:MAG: hypothetical protein EON96_12430, partial [Caulobacteraceae bacterium]
APATPDRLSSSATRIAALDDNLSGVAGAGDFANLSSQADTFVGWVNSAKQAFRKEADAKAAA